MPRKLTQEEVLNNFKKIHGSRYDYRDVFYKGLKKEVSIKCSVHGDFKQMPHKHYYSGCPKCGGESSRKKRSLGIKEVVRRARKIHGNKYSYPDQKYSNNKVKIKIVCNFCKIPFFQSTDNHIGKSAKGCPSCHSRRVSKGERSITEFLTSNCIDFTSQKTFRELKNNGRPLRFDFYLPRYNLAIEFDGIQHFKQSDLFKESVEDVVFRDGLKNEFCKEKEIYLLRIKYNELRETHELLSFVLEEMEGKKLCPRM